MKYMVLNVRNLAVYICEILDSTRYRIYRACDKETENPTNIAKKDTIFYFENMRTDIDRYDFETLEEAETQMLLEML